MTNHHQTERDEEVIFSMRTHPKVLLPSAFAAVVLITVAVAIGVLMPAEGLFVWARLIGWGFCVLFFLILVLAPFLRWRFSRFIVTDQRVKIRTGMIARNGTDVLLTRVTGIETERSILDRVSGCGTLVIKDAASPEGTIMRDIPDPLQVRQVISDLAYDAIAEDRPRGDRAMGD